MVEERVTLKENPKNSLMYNWGRYIYSTYSISIWDFYVNSTSQFYFTGIFTGRISESWRKVQLQNLNTRGTYQRNWAFHMMDFKDVFGGNFNTRSG